MADPFTRYCTIAQPGTDETAMNFRRRLPEIRWQPRLSPGFPAASPPVPGVTIRLMPFPIHRLRRLRVSESMRSLVRETHLNPAQFVLPLFVCPGEGIKREISSMPHNYQMSIDEIVKECAEVEALGIGGVILFGLPESKDEMATGAYDENGIVQKAIRAIKRETSSLLVMTDVCNCEYTSHGHCGYVKDGDVDNDTTLQWLAKSALSHARAGADIVGPSDMMDGRGWAIRQGLDPHGLRAQGGAPGRTAKPRNRRRNSATAAAPRWIPPTDARPCARLNSTSRKGRT